MTPASAREPAHTVLAPAKLNLGLEVVGRRPDGYHAIVSIFQTVSICDRLTFTPADPLEVISSEPTLDADDNLVLAALRLLRERTGSATGARVELEKEIPLAAGLGGASSDAAATLRGAAQLWGLDLDADRLAQLASELGSDVPFFLHGGTALVTGRGEEIAPLPPLTGGWFVVVAPAFAIPRKTATLYAALRPEDWTSGERVREQAARLRRGEPLAPNLLHNAFARALVALRPEVVVVQHAMYAAGAPWVALSGAGPSHYTYVRSRDEAARVTARVAARLGRLARVFVCEPMAEPIA